MSTDATPSSRGPKQAPPGGPAKTSIKSTPIKSTSVRAAAATPVKSASVPPVATVTAAPPAAPSSSASAAPAAKTLRAPRKRPVKVTAPIVDPEYRRALVAEEAYLRSERRHFAQGYEVEDWLSAESEIDMRLKLGLVPPAR